MRFWDASSLVPLIVTEPSSKKLEVLVTQDSQMAVWWATEVECESALARRRRPTSLSGRGLATGREVLARLVAAWTEVGPSTRIRARALRLVRVHPLSAADAFQLAAALEWGSDNPSGLEFVTLDMRLAEAARLEGFPVLPDEGPE